MNPAICDSESQRSWTNAVYRTRGEQEELQGGVRRWGRPMRRTHRQLRNNMLVGLGRFEISTRSGGSLRILGLDIGVSLTLPR